MRKGFGLLILAAAGAWIYSQSRNFINTLSVGLGKISFDWKLTQQQAFMFAVFNVNLLLRNQSAVNASVTGGKIMMFLNDRLVGGVDSIAITRIVENGVTTIPLVAKVSTLNLVPTISNLIAMINTGAPIKFRIQGVINTSVGVFNIDEVQEVKL